MLFGLLFGTALVLIRTALPEGAEEGAQWLDSGSTRMRVAAILMPFAGIAFLWFIGVVRDGFGRLEDKFFSTVFIGAGLTVSGDDVRIVGHRCGPGRQQPRRRRRRRPCGGGHLRADGPDHVDKTYALRMGAVFMISLATIWLKTGLMPRWLVIVTYVLALGILFASDISMWMTLAFPVWVLIVSVLLLAKAGVIDLDGDR